MNLQEQINRIQKMMGVISENNIPTSIRRRINISMTNILNKLKESVIRLYKPNEKENTISQAFLRVAEEIIFDATIDTEYYAEESVTVFKDYLENEFKDEIDRYYDLIFGGENDEIGYCFYKHKERHGGNGFSDCTKGWHQFLKKYGFWFPDLDWNEIKDKLDSLSSNSKLLIKNPLENHPYHYYFSVSKNQ